MKNAILVLALAGVACKAPVDPANPFDEKDFDPILLTPEAQTVAEANNGFAFDVLGVVGQDSDENLFYSPFSMFTAFSMVLAGAGGNTAAELAQALHVDPLASSTWHGDFGPVLSALIRPDEAGICKTDLANQLFGQKGLAFEDPFTETCADDYQAPLQDVDFVANPEAARAEINGWVGDHTDGRIEDLLPKGSLTTDTRLVLANAILFEGSWLWTFDEAETQDGAFTRFDGTDVQVPMMSQELDLPIAEHDGARLTRLPYGCGDMSMILILPSPFGDGEDIRDIEARIDADWLDAATDAWSVEDSALLRIPKFSFDHGLNVPTTFKALGVNDLWTGAADLSPMTSEDDLYASDAFHEAFVEVDEKGTEAAAATAVVTNDKGGGGGGFIANKPFLFLIRDEAAGVVLFMGRVADPS